VNVDSIVTVEFGFTCADRNKNVAKSVEICQNYC